MKISVIKKVLLIPLLFAGVATLQRTYDTVDIRAAQAKFGLPPIALVKTFDLGLHAAAASFFWVNDVIFEVPLLRVGLDRLMRDLALVNDLDPRFSFPYYFTVLVIPDERHPDRVAATIEIGEHGVREADPDWRVPFFLAIAYHLYTDDRVSAARNYDIAARSPGIPFYAKRFSENFGIAQNARAETIAAWRIIAASAEEAGDQATKERAEVYIERLTIFDLLEEAARIYRHAFGKFPEYPHDLVAAGILSKIPRDPLGFEFTLGGDGSAGIVK
ncbi:MAG: hypothetical protein A2945_02505 [Candidatus Liptonbacteria bacterium RIFCSPLOWO2_01_FULL_52_25]|uniref:Uncharacterized protein n=1 Tax=Candidatus Liptonbacteria bacterium RIFCSPLOWO2_01_FULL_52_25 TaxID=1798650 RepID=A0A1G2CF47_9BACT|nr:MAG: hypothetical protein A2945_02505 [Candidatus Liptonbacteria bacterium RIFCSPLOWO2_01_FULL_52_25]